MPPSTSDNLNLVRLLRLAYPYLQEMHGAAQVMDDQYQTRGTSRELDQIRELCRQVYLALRKFN